MTSEAAKDDDKWADTANLYVNQAARLTELHGADLVTLLKNEILQAKTILDIGCGTGAFAKAYLQQFPMGVPGQTLILSDFSAGILEQAKQTVKPPEGCQTKIMFQEEDGTRLVGIIDDSIDIVVSLFGVFLIPDQDATRTAIQRVLAKPTGVLGIASWQFGISDALVKQGFGVSLQDAFELPNKVIDPNESMLGKVVKEWSTHDAAKRILSEKYKMSSVSVSSAIHTSVWEFEAMWTMMVKNPVSNIQGASDSDVSRAKDALLRFVTQDGKLSVADPLFLTSVSNLCIGRGTLLN